MHQAQIKGSAKRQIEETPKLPLPSLGYCMTQLAFVIIRHEIFVAFSATELFDVVDSVVPFF